MPFSGCIARVCSSISTLLKVIVVLMVLVALQCAEVAAGPVAYATCQAAAATGCAVITGPMFIACQTYTRTATCASMGAEEGCS